MKRFILIIGVLFSGLTMKAQSFTYTCRYWFDQDHEQALTTTFGENTWSAELDVGSLSGGLHTLHLQVTDTSMRWSTPQSYLFINSDSFEPDTIEMDQLIYHCWFDQDFEHQLTDSIGNGFFFFDVSQLDEGTHTIHIMLKGNSFSSTQSYLFIKSESLETDTIDMTRLVYHCWFDQDFEHRLTDSIGDGLFLLDVDSLSDGLHTVHVMLEGSTYTSTQSYLFLKAFSIISEEIHLTKWEYCLNDDLLSRHITELNPWRDTLDILGLLPVGHPSIRSSCFHFHPNGNEPYINAKNHITFRFWDTENRLSDISSFYVDEQVQQSITAEIFERNTTETFTAPRNNQIQWFKLDAGIGDSLVFKADKACTMQLFAPSGEEVYNVSGSGSIVLDGCHAWEDGIYYLAVHDVTGSGEIIEVTYNHIDKYVVLAYTPTEIGNTWGVFEVDLLGNGFDKLNNVILVDGSNEWQMDTIMYSHISEAAIRFAMNSTTNNGNYDIVLCFEDQVGELDTLILSNAIQVADAEFGTIDIDYNYQFNTTPPYLIRIIVTNNGNVEYQGVPLNICYTNTENVGFSLFNDWITVQEDFFENGGRAIYHTDNMFNHGIEGNIIPLIIPKLGSHGTREIILNVDAERGTGFDFYVYGGIPWSLKTEEAYDADDYYCQTHPDSPGWGGHHNGGNGGNSGSTHGGTGGSSGGARFTVGAHNPSGGNCHGVASDVYFDSCEGLADPCNVASHIVGDVQECLCGLTMGIGKTLGNMLNVMQGLTHRAQLNGYGINSLEEARELLGSYGVSMWRSAYHRRLETPASLLRGAIGHCTGLLPDVAQYAVDAGLEAWGMLEDDCAQPPLQRPSIPRPCEPNEIRGYLAESGSHYMMQEIQTITYEIESENDTTATAAAHTIIVRDTLDVNKFDVASLAAYRVTIGDKVMELNGEHEFIYTMDLRPNLYVIAQIQQECDPVTGIVVWTITSLDPMTMEPTDDPYQGALPINYNGEGIATFTYNINLNGPFPDGTEISNRVGIIFDLEEPVLTDTWTNIVDAVKPTSHIENVTFEADTLNFSFVSSDNRSGVWYHTLYYRNDSTEMEWKVKVPRILENSYMLRFNEYQTTEYLVMAVDSAGNVEDKDMVAEYVHYYDGPEPVCQTTNLSQGWNWFSTYIDGNPVELLAMLEESLGEHGILIESLSDGVNENLGDGFWMGDLDGVGVTTEQMYMIEVDADCTVELQGVAANPANHAITIHPEQWTWIGFPCSEEVDILVALSGFEAEEGDLIESLEGGIAEYLGDGLWMGFETMVPGQGYMYYSNSSEPKILIYVLNRGKKAGGR